MQTMNQASQVHAAINRSAISLSDPMHKPPPSTPRELLGPPATGGIDLHNVAEAGRAGVDVPSTSSTSDAVDRKLFPNLPHDHKLSPQDQIGLPAAGPPRADISYTPDLGYRHDVDGLRGLAVLAVIIYHLDDAYLPGGFTGVDVFFVISGYVVAASLLRKPAPTLRSYFGGFFARRVKRLAPALAVTVFIAGFLTASLVPPDTRSLSEFYTSGLLALAGVSNVYFAYFTTRAAALGGTGDSSGSALNYFEEARYAEHRPGCGSSPLREGRMLCYAVLCCAMLCYAVLCCAMLCYALLCCAMANNYFCAMLCYVMLCAML